MEEEGQEASFLAGSACKWGQSQPRMKGCLHTHTLFALTGSLRPPEWKERAGRLLCQLTSLTNASRVGQPKGLLGCPLQNTGSLMWVGGCPQPPPMGTGLMVMRCHFQGNPQVMSCHHFLLLPANRVKLYESKTLW